MDRAADQPQGMADPEVGTPLSRQVAQAVHSTSFEDLPEEVVEAAKALILDALGIAFASRNESFAEQALHGVWRIAGDGKATVMGSGRTLDSGNAALLNGLLIHGLDFDDTHLAGVVHTSAGALPAALAAGELEGRSGWEVLRAFVLGTEVSARVGMAAAGRFHKQGFHPTGVAGAFGAAIAAGLLFDLSEAELATAQGIVGSMASGLLEFLEEGAGTKRIHPGWAAHAGLTAASLAGTGFTSPSAIYEGRFGLYASHLGARDLPLASISEGIGESWETLNVAVKPYPACHFVHAFIDAALQIKSGEDFGADDITEINCKIAAGEVETVCEPVANKRRPKSTYDAQFSVPFVIASAIVKDRRLGIQDFDEDSKADERILALAEKVNYEVDPNSGFPKHFSGEVTIELGDGRTLSWREQINRGAPERPLSQSEIRDKFDLNARLTLAEEQAQLVADTVQNLEKLESVDELMSALRTNLD